MTKKEFNIVVTHQKEKAFNVKAETWQGAVEVAYSKAEAVGLLVIGGVMVFDSNNRLVDTYK